MSPWVPAVAALCLALGALLLIVVLLGPRKEERQTRLDEINLYVTPAEQARAEAQQRTRFTERLVEISNRASQDRKKTHRTAALLRRADLPVNTGEWLILRVIAPILTAALGSVLLPSVVVGLLVGAVAGVVVPPVVLKVLAGRRARKFEAILPDVLSLVATSLTSGFGLAQALEAVARDASEPAAKEFSRALAETRLGTELPDALDRLAERMDSTSMRWTVMAIRIQHDVGGNLAGILQTTAATLRERETLRGQVATLSAEGRMSAFVLLALPFGLFGYMLLTNYDYISRLWTEPLGLAMLIGAGVMLVGGIFWMRSMVRIEV